MPKVKISDVYTCQWLDMQEHATESTHAGNTGSWPWHCTGIEREFLRLIQEGSEEEIAEYVQMHPNMHVDCSDLTSKGQRVLEIAVACRGTNLVTLLLSLCTFSVEHLQCGMVQAVVENDINTLEVLLDVFGKRKEDVNRENVDARDSPSMLVPSSNMTPIMKAAILGNMEIVRLLLERGYEVTKPHSHRCTCEKCTQRNAKGEKLSESIARINVYRALASPVYIMVTSEDPILRAFKLSQELKRLSQELPEHQSAYQQLSEQCSKFAADLLNQCCDTREVKLVLMQRKGFPDPRPYQFSRLRLAILYQQKQFVAHPSCQQVLRSMWVKGLPSWWSWSMRQQLWHVVKHTLLFPLMCLGSIITPFPFICRRVRVPVNKFIYSAASYVVFLCLLFSTLIVKKKHDIRRTIAWTDAAVAVWIVGHSWDLLMNLCLLGVRTFLRSWWAVYDLIMFIFFLVAELIWLVVFLVERYGTSDLPPVREQWEWNHPYLIGEGIYAIASILAFMRLLLWYQMNSQLGPLSISLRYMAGDVFRFLLLIFIIMFAFVAGINSLYGNYEDAKLYKDDGSVEEQNEDFVTVRKSLRTVFWALFGFGSPESTDLLTLSTNGSNTTVHHSYTELLGYSLWGIYHIITVVVLINMLIAMLSDSYQRVNNNADIEWKFARSSILLSFLDNQSSVPPPFNLIPTLHCVTGMGKCLWRHLTGKAVQSPYNHLQRCFLEEDNNMDDQNERIEGSYQNLMVILVHRYLHSENQFSNQKIELQPDALERLKLDILEDLKKTIRKEIYKSHEKISLSRKRSSKRRSSSSSSGQSKG